MLDQDKNFYLTSLGIFVTRLLDYVWILKKLHVNHFWELGVNYELRVKDTGKRRESVSHIYSLLSNDWFNRQPVNASGAQVS